MRLTARSGRVTVLLALTYFAVWTICYEVALAASFRAVPTFIASVAIWLIGGLLVLRRRMVALRDRGAAVARALHGAPGTRTVLLALGLTAVGWSLAVAEMRPLAMDLGLVAAAAYLVLRWRRRPARRVGLTATATLPGDDGDVTVEPDPAAWPHRDPSPGAARNAPVPDQGGLWLVGWLMGLASAALASVLVRPNADDAFFVNVSAWVADRGTFPVRDTMISNQELSPLGSHTPNVSSIESLFGVVARLAGTPPGTIVYVAAVPVLTLLAYLALTWLVAESRIPKAPIGLVAATVGMWMSGESRLAVGTFPLRIWQGKIALVAVVLPLLILAAMRVAARGSLLDHLFLGSTVVASVGMSNTAVFLAPLMLAGLTVAALAVGGLRPALRVGAWILLPLATGAVVAVLAPAGPTPAQLAAIGFRDPGVLRLPLVEVPGKTASILTSTVLAVGLGWLGIRDRLTRAATLGLLVAVGLFLLPPVQQAAASAAGIGAILWRTWWAVPAPLLMVGVVGLAADAPLRLARRTRTAFVAAVATAVALVPLVAGSWAGAATNGTRWASPGTWKLPADSLAGARLALTISRPGDIILAPQEVSLALAGLTVSVHPVAARPMYLPDYTVDPGAHTLQRIEVQDFADNTVPPRADIPSQIEALRTLSVDTICLETRRSRARNRVRALGFHLVGEVGGIACYRR